MLVVFDARSCFVGINLIMIVLLCWRSKQLLFRFIFQKCCPSWRKCQLLSLCNEADDVAERECRLGLAASLLHFTSVVRIHTLTCSLSNSLPLSYLDDSLYFHIKLEFIYSRGSDLSPMKTDGPVHILKGQRMSGLLTSLKNALTDLVPLQNRQFFPVSFLPEVMPYTQNPFLK